MPHSLPVNQLHFALVSVTYNVYPNKISLVRYGVYFDNEYIVVERKKENTSALFRKEKIVLRDLTTATANTLSLSLNGDSWLQRLV